MEIEILHVEGCPNWRDTADHVTVILAELGANQPPIRVTLLFPPTAARVLFTGSPTILIDEADAFPFDGRTQQALNGSVVDRWEAEWANASRDFAHPRLPQFRGSGSKGAAQLRRRCDTVHAIPSRWSSAYRRPSGSESGLDRTSVSTRKAARSPFGLSTSVSDAGGGRKGLSAAGSPHSIPTRLTGRSE